MKQIGSKNLRGQNVKICETPRAMGKSAVKLFSYGLKNVSVEKSGLQIQSKDVPSTGPIVVRKGSPRSLMLPRP